MGNELYHYGVQGMRWGVRRYQNKDGTLTPEGERRLEKYKIEETERVTKKYQVDKYNKHLSKIDEAYGPYDDNYSVSRVSRAQYRALKASGMEYMEKKKIASMTYQDMIDEQTSLRRAKAKQFLSGLSKQIVGAIIRESAPSPFINVDEFKTNRRVGLEESIYNEYEARRLSGYRGF